MVPSRDSLEHIAHTLALLEELGLQVNLPKSHLSATWTVSSGTRSHRHFGLQGFSPIRQDTVTHPGSCKGQTGRQNLSFSHPETFWSCGSDDSDHPIHPLMNAAPTTVIHTSIQAAQAVLQTLLSIPPGPWQSLLCWEREPHLLEAAPFCLLDSQLMMITGASMWGWATYLLKNSVGAQWKPSPYGGCT